MKFVQLFTVLLVLLFSMPILAEWSDSEKRILKSLSLGSLPPLPADPSNAFLTDPQARLLGQALFFDTRLSANGKISCATCHKPQNYFADGLKTAVGIGKTNRNTPTVIGSAWLRWFYWDGRRDSLWSQALIPFEAVNEMGSSRLAVVRFVGKETRYRQWYESIFGRYPTLLLQDRFNVDAGPIGSPASRNQWYRLTEIERKQINRAFSNIGKAIAAYESTLRPPETRFDQYVEAIISGEKPFSFSQKEILGAKLFIDNRKTQCLQCHNGPLLSNGGFHNIGSGNFEGKSLDFGRVFGLQSVLVDEFNCLGEYSDADRSQCHSLRFLNKSHHIPLKGAFKTPSLRGAPDTAPYFHDGRFDSLEAVIDYYNNPPKNNGPHELNALGLTGIEREALVAFLMTLQALRQPSDNQ